MSSRASMAAALLLDLRTPLARLSIAAQRLGREAVRPADQTLAVGMQDAVDELDARIDRILPLLVEFEATPTADLQPVAPILHGLAQRLRPALDASDITLTTTLPSETIEIDAHAARRLGATLVRSGAAWVGHRGTLELSVLADAAERGIQLRCERAPDAGTLDRCGAEVTLAPELSAHADRWIVTNETPDRVRISAWLGQAAS